MFKALLASLVRATLSFAAATLLITTQSYAETEACFPRDQLERITKEAFDSYLKIRAYSQTAENEPLVMEIFINDKKEMYVYTTNQTGQTCLTITGTQFTVYEDRSY